MLPSPWIIDLTWSTIWVWRSSGAFGSTRSMRSYRRAIAAGDDTEPFAVDPARPHVRPALVGAYAQLLLERDLAEQRDVELVGQQLAAALAEDREPLAGRRREARHVLHHARDLEVEALGGLGRALCHLLRGRLRRGD